MFAKAVNDWQVKWVPAILEYSYTLTGKKASTVLSVQRKHEGKSFSFHARVHNNAIPFQFR